jgi:hypothetical protein
MSLTSSFRHSFPLYAHEVLHVAASGGVPVLAERGGLSVAVGCVPVLTKSGGLAVAMDEQTASILLRRPLHGERK